MANTPLKTVVFQEGKAERRLTELGLDLPGLTQVVQQGEFARAQATDHDPVAAGAYDAYRYRVRSLRDIYRPRGWEVGRDSGLELLVSGCGRRAVITRGGDAGVGDPSAHPQPKRAVGETTARAVGNNASLWLDSDWWNTEADPQNSDASRDSARETWMLLVFRQGDIVYIELSLPSGVTEDGDVLGWLERVILPPLDVSHGPSIDATDSGETIDVPVKRRK